MRDRLENLKGLSPSNSTSTNEEEQYEEQDTLPVDNPLMGTISDARLKLKTLSAIIDTIDRHHRAALSSTDPKQSEREQKHVELETTHFTALCDDLRLQLRSCSNTLRDSDTPVDTKRMRTLLQVTTRKFLDCCRQFEKQSARHQRARQEDMSRRLRLLRPSLTPSQAGELIEHGVPQDQRIYSPVHSPQLLSAEAMEERRRQAQGELSWMEARRAEMQRLSESAAQVAAMMSDIALLVQQQGEVVDRVEEFLSGAEAYGKKGKEQLEIAHKKAELRRKRKITMIITVIVAVIILLIMAFFFMTLNPMVTIMFYVVAFLGLAGGLWWLYRRLSPSRLLGLKQKDAVDEFCDCCNCCCGCVV